jgi:signal transduction histidine kinase
MRRFRLPWARPFSSGAFRFAFLLACAFALGSLALLFVVERLIDRYIDEGLSDAVATETEILYGEAQELGETGLIHAIERHARAVHDTAFRYLLVDRSGRRLAGSLPTSLRMTGWRELTVMTRDEQGVHPIGILAQGVILPDGSVLVVGGDMEDMRELRWQLTRFTAASGVVIAVLALVGGLWAGTVFLRRLDQTNQTINRIISGHVSERLPRFGISREFDELTDNLNTMLDRIEGLMDGLRQVSVDVAHDLRTPLTRLRNRIEGMQAGAAPEEIEAQLESCIEQIDEVIRLFSSLLRIANLENGKAQADFENFDLSALLGRLGAAYAPAIEDEGRHLAMTIATGVTCHGDRDLIAQAVTNLLENAARHTPRGSRLSLLLAGKAGEGPRIVVQDDGPGVPEEDRAKVLRRFFRLDRSRTTAGSGLGLALVAAIVHLHEGTITLEDAAPGLRVVLSLPRA